MAAGEARASVERPEHVPAVACPIVDEPAGGAVRQHDVIGIPRDWLGGPALDEPPGPGRLDDAPFPLPRVCPCRVRPLGSRPPRSTWTPLGCP